MKSHHFDAIIVGGGPAGSSAAIRLAQQGRQVALVDKARFPRDKCCGDGLTTGALRELEELGFRPSALSSWRTIDTVTVRSPSGRIVELPLGSGGCFGAVVKRAELDEALVALARSHACHVIEEKRCEKVAPHDPSALAVHLDDGSVLSAPYVLAADGAHSKIRRDMVDKQGAPFVPSQKRPHWSVPGIGQWLAYRQYIRHNSKEADRQIWVLFEKTVLPGYVWSFPLADGVVNVGACFLQPAGAIGKNAADLWRQAMHSPFLASLLGQKATPLQPARAWPIPTTIDTAMLTGFDGRLLFIGDAARVGDTMSGEGVGQALASSRIATNVLADIDATQPGDAATRYVEAIRESLLADQKIASVLSTTLSHPISASGAVRLCGLNAWTRRAAGRWLFEDYPRNAIKKPQLWRQIATHERAPFADAPNAS